MAGKYRWFLIYGVTVLVFLLVVNAGNKAVNTIAENVPFKRSQCIIIDAGHGGPDGGAVSCTGIYESNINLEISLRLRDLFHLMGYETKMIRSEDISIYTTGETLAQKKISDLKERVRIVNNTPNALLLSIHQNTFSDNRYSGAQVFHTELPSSKELAAQLQSQLISHLNPHSNRAPKKASGIYLMEHIQCTGILIECGFLSNPEEEHKLTTKSYQLKLCSVIAATVATYRGHA